jgi:hypothetical protein
MTNTVPSYVTLKFVVTARFVAKGVVLSDPLIILYAFRALSNEIPYNSAVCPEPNPKRPPEIANKSAVHDTKTPPLYACADAIGKAFPVVCCTNVPAVYGA